METTTEKTDLDALIASANETIKKGVDFLVKNGKLIEFDGWLSITEYAEKYGVTTQNVSQWILRGVIPPHYVIEIDKFGKKLVRDKAYKP